MLPESTPQAPAPTSPVRLDPLADPAAFDNALDTTSGSFLAKAGLLRSVDWAAFPGRGRPAMADRLAAHADPEIRIIGTVALAAWSHGDRLVALLDDGHAWVRKAAMYSLGKVGPDSRFAGPARDRLTTAVATSADETLTTYVHHTEPAERDSFLLGLVRHSDRWGLRSRAVDLLVEVGADHLLAPVIGLLAEPPTVHWAFHTALLETVPARTAPPSLVAPLIEVDNIHLAAAAARTLTDPTGSAPVARSR